MTLLRPLAERPDALPAIAALYRRVWPDWYGPDGRGDAERDLAERARRDGLPWGVVAFEAGAPVGAAALAATSFGAEPGEGLWIVGLCVAPHVRRRGIGASLLAALEERAAGPVRATTASARGLLLRRGWRLERDVGAGQAVFRLG